MASAVDICNLALSHIGVPTIQALTESNRQARECSRLYPLLRDAVLSEFPWNFARRRVVLALVSGEEVSGWTFVYAYPSDCLRALEIYNPLTTQTYTDGQYVSGQLIESIVKVKSDKIKFEIAVNEAKNQRLILTDQEAAELIYTARVEDTNLFSSSFIDALSWRVAADLAIPLKGKMPLQQQMLAVYEAKLGKSRQANANEHFEPPSGVSSYVTARK
jgi:hypothetical protein